MNSSEASSWQVSIVSLTDQCHVIHIPLVKMLASRSFVFRAFDVVFFVVFIQLSIFSFYAKF